MFEHYEYRTRRPFAQGFDDDSVPQVTPHPEHYLTLPGMSNTLTERLQRLVAHHREQGEFAQVRDALRAVANEVTPDALVAAAEPLKDDPALAAPLYEVIVEAQPANARALVILANAYWLLGTGTEVVANLASRAIEADATNRGAWHLWALSESDPRARTTRWQQVAERFPADDLARVNVADNAAAVAGAEHDYDMLDLAVSTYTDLLARATDPSQKAALETALAALRGWKF